MNIAAALAVHDELGDTLVAVKRQLKSAIRAEAGLLSRDDEKPNGGFAQADFNGTTLSVNLPLAGAGGRIWETIPIGKK